MSENQRDTVADESLDSKLERLTAFYNKQIPVAKLELEYEKLQTEIATEKARQKQAQVALANLSNPQKTQNIGVPQGPKPPAPEPEKK